MSHKLTPKIMLEGTHLTFKTDIAFALNEHPRFVGPRKHRYHFPLISAKWCAFTSFPWGRGLIDFHWLEERLLPFNFRLIFLDLTPVPGSGGSTIVIITLGIFPGGF